MEQTTKQTQLSSTKQENHTVQGIIGTVFGLIEIILAFRFVLKLLGANPKSGFVKFIYDITQFFVGIFEGIFSKATATGAETKAIFEPGTLIAILVIAIIAWVVLRLIRPRASNTSEKVEYTERDNQNKPQV